MDIRKILFLSILVLISVGMVSATNYSNGTSTNDTTKMIEKSTSITNSINDNSINEYDKNIYKESSNEKNIKTASKMYDISDYNSLHEAFTSDIYDNVTVNIISDIKLTNHTSLNDKIKSLCINGNNKTVNGDNKYSFFSADSGINHNIEINNLTIANCNSYMGGAINNYVGNITLIHTKFNNNCANYGGAIYVENTELNIINSTFEYNTAISISDPYDGFGGAIYLGEGSKINIDNSKFTNNTALTGGSIYSSSFSSITINNSTFIANSAENKGGVLYISEGNNVVISNSIMNNNQVSYDYNGYGGAIFLDGWSVNSGGETPLTSKLNIENSEFNNNSACSGGVINSDGGIISIDNSKFNYNYASGSGVIYLKNSKDSKITNSVFKQNWAEFENGAIQIHKTNYTLIKNCTFTSNKAYDGAGSGEGESGALYIYGSFNNVTNCNFSNNYAWIGAAIKIASSSNQKSLNNIIDSNIFNNNTCPFSSGNIIYISTDNTQITNNTFNDNKYTDIEIYGNNNTIKNNEFNDELITTNITLTLPTSTVPQYNNVTIKGKFMTKYGNVLSNTNLKLNINNETVTVKTNSNGIYTYKFNATKVGTNTVNVTFNGNKKYEKSNIVKSFNVIILKEGIITINKINGTQYKDKVLIIGNFTEKNGKILKNTNLKLFVNDMNYTVKTNSLGIYNKTITANIVGKNNITVTYPGNTKYKATSTKSTFNVAKADTKINNKNISTKYYNDNVTITGKFVDKNNNILKNTLLKISYNNKTYNVKTNNKGEYTLKVKVNKVGTNYIKISYNGNNNYKATTTQTTFNTLKRKTNITLANFTNNTKKGKTIKITGKLTDYIGTPLKNTSVKIKINNQTVSLKTNTNGIYTYDYKTNKIGKNNLTVTYPGNTNYSSTQVKKTFNIIA